MDQQRVQGYRRSRIDLLRVQVKATDVDVRNTMLFTAIDCGMVTINFNSSFDEYASHAAALELSRNSIKVTGDITCDT
jgi:hypothetical protein